jgi:hypothetical protein
MKKFASDANCCFLLCLVAGVFNSNVLLAQTQNERNPSGVPRAVRANDFLNSIGVATHMSQGADDPAQVASSVTFAGIRNIRDDDNPNLVPSFISVHKQAGAKFVLVSSAPNDTTYTNLLRCVALEQSSCDHRDSAALRDVMGECTARRRRCAIVCAMLRLHI